jgi:hypothetical protein
MAARVDGFWKERGWTPPVEEASEKARAELDPTLDEAAR